MCVWPAISAPGRSWIRRPRWNSCRLLSQRSSTLVYAASLLRREHFERRVRLNYLVNLKSGLCQEDCSYCSQASGSLAPILKYSWLEPEEAVRQAEAGIAGGAARVCPGGEWARPYGSRHRTSLWHR